MLALNSPSVSPTILITIPFGQTRKTASTALVLIKKSELAILAASIGQFRPGRGPDNLITGENTSLWSFLIGCTGNALLPTPSGGFSSSITNASAPSDQ